MVRNDRARLIKSAGRTVVEALEARQLLTAYVGQSLVDYFHLSSVLLDSIAPPAGAVYADFGRTIAFGS